MPSNTLAPLLARDGRFKEALDYPDRAEPRLVGLRNQLFAKRAEVLDIVGDTSGALEQYAGALSVTLKPSYWRRIQTLSAKLGQNPDEWLERSRKIRAENEWIFPNLKLETSTQRTVDLYEFLVGPTVITFFSPG